jgi:PAS domain S-box-containing protein
MVFSEQDTEDLKSQLAELRATLKSLSKPVQAANSRRRTSSNQNTVAIDRVLAALDRIETNLAYDSGFDGQVAYNIRPSEQLYTSIFDNSPFAFTLSSMPSGVFVRVNDAFLNLFEYTRADVIGKTSTELEITDPESRSRVAALFQKNGSVKNFAYTHKTKSGNLLTLSLSLDWVVISGEKFVLTSIQDITAEQLAHQALTESLAVAQKDRQRLLAVMESMPVGVAILDEHGGNLQANQAFDQVWGDLRPQVENVGDYAAYQAWWADSGLPIQPEEWASAQAIQHGRTIIGQVLKIQKFDGSLAFVHNSAAPILDQQGKVTGCAVTIQDITQLKLHEAEIDHLNCTLKALSDSNQAMLHIADEQEYLNLVCRIIIEDCGFTMVWVGYAEHDRKKSVRPVASAGFDQGYLDQMKITWANTARGRGPTGTAIRTQKPCRCNNMLTDPKFAPWRDAAVQRGYASSLVLPLVAHGKSIGALNIYSRQPEGFSDDEEKLLLELANDLAFGITTLRLKADHELAEAALHESEKRYRTIVETSREGIVLSTPDGIFSYVNQRMVDMLGYPVEEILGKSSLDFAYPGSTAQFRQARTRLSKGEALHGEFKFLRKDGTVLWSLFNASPIINERGEHMSNLAMHTDITERKRLDEHLAYLASFPERNPRPVIEVDLSGDIKYANPAALRFFPGIMAEKLAHEYFTGWDEVVNALNTEPGGVTVRDVKVGEHYFEQSLNLLPSQSLVRIYGVDVTDRKLASQMLLEAHEQLEQRVLRRTEELNTANEQLRAEIKERQKAQTELEMSMQELQVIEEELRNNNDLLLDAQTVLDTERQRYQDLFDYAPDGYLVTDSNGLILEANQYACKLLGIAPSRLNRKPLIVFVAQSDHTVLINLLNTLIHTSVVQSHELRLHPRHGPDITVAVTVSSAQDRDGKSVLRWTLRDITEKKRAEEIIQQNLLRNELLAELSQSLAEVSLDQQSILHIVARTIATFVGDGCVIDLVSADGKWLEPVAWYHRQMEVVEIMDTVFATSHHPVNVGISGKVFQSSQPSLVEKISPEVLKIVPPEIRLYAEQVGVSSILVVPLLIGTKVVGTISLFRNQDGQPYTSENRDLLEIIAYRAAQTIHNARLYHDLQESMRKEIETHNQLVQTEKFAAVGRLLASITHEINNPLQTIKNCLYLSQVDTPEGTSIYDALTMAVAETNRLSNLVAQLREIYRPPTSGVIRPVNIPQLLDEVKLLLTGYLKEKHVIWVFNPEEASLFDNLVVEGVSDQLKQVFLNISLNAMDAMEQHGGKIMITLKKSDDGSQAGICFKDTGPGLPQEVKARLFEPFVTTKEKGLGLGLMICYDIVQKHLGSIEVKSVPGEGAAFTIWLPSVRIDGEKA